MRISQLLTPFIRSYLFIVFIVISQILSSEVPRPRGVSLSRASLYNPEKDFKCFDGSLIIPFTQINDDYCDCPDGSDEPGTAACPNGVFHCTNGGHKPLNLHSSRVNDGVCDCCDGTDEYLHKHVKCVNNCFELGQSAREEAQRQAELLKIGSQIRLEFSQKGIQLKQEKKDKLSDLLKQDAEAQHIVQEKEALKKEAEDLENQVLEQYRKIEEENRKQKLEEELASTRPEAIDTFRKFDTNQDGLVDVMEIQAHSTFDKDRNGEVSEEEAKYFLDEQSSVDEETFVTTAWSLIKPFLMVEESIFKPPVGDAGDKEEEHGDETDASDLEPPEDADDKEESEGDADDEEEEEGHVAEEAKPPPPPSPKYDDETQKIVDAASNARTEYHSANDAASKIKSEINDVEQYLKTDFGVDDEFAILESECFEYTDHEYIYKLCPFNKVIQQPKSSSLETHLGKWGEWIGVENKYSVMHFTGGQSCWNGPERSTKVRVVCGSENKVTAVTEPNKCEYQFDFTTPAACRESMTDSEHEIHDEL
ncbi:hypothetical protein PPYR_04096 [Photinus pyralis]|uniref:Glucosidase 2 subunit beta n=2 Tax=Photinus pyralis TaxID=7054 RepID=A0A5N4AXM0_PHOPY|nr:glucosidase 2 subunit beta isoform X1 [Photinus pyralis]KAB0801910.1 hypothetical protein PPYR_04096 [Photinus pyralis]